MATKFRNTSRPNPAVNPLAAQAPLLLKQAIGLHQKGQTTEAQKIYEAVLKAQPKNADALHLLGVIAAQAKQHERAIELIGKAIAVNPKVASFYSNRSNALLEMKRSEEALEGFDKAIVLKSDFAEGHSNRSNALLSLSRPEEALASCDRALAIRADFVDALVNRGHALRMLRRVQEAIADYEQAIALRPDNAIAHWGMSLALLANGDLEKGWVEFEWGWRVHQRGVQRDFAQPLWQGTEPLAGKTILLHSEQGFGDTIQFCRYAAMVAGLGARVVLETPKRLVHLLAGLTGVSEMVAAGQDLPAFDYHCPLMSLPLAFKTSVATIPQSPRYLRSTPAKVQEWADRLGPQLKPRVGLVWSGSAENRIDFQRSMTFADIAALLSDEFEFVSLQKEVRGIDQAVLQANPQVRHFGDEQQDFSDAAALCELMDVVVSVDTAVAHLSGALGKPTWIMLSYAPDWRWMLDRDDSQWYPSVKLYRQETLGDWCGVFCRVSADLHCLRR